MTTCTNTKTVRAIAFSVGGSPQPIIFSLNRYKPEYIYFLCSQRSLDSVPEILKSLEFAYDRGKVKNVLIDDPDDLISCFEKADRIFHNMFAAGIKREEILVDYTGGTKNMTAAITLASARFGIDYIYVGGRERTKDGLGIVIDGAEEIKGCLNPWSFFAVEDRQKIAHLFNHYQFTAACLHIDQVLAKVDGGTKIVYRYLRDVIQGFDLWDHFKYEEASKLVNQEKLASLKDLSEIRSENAIADLAEKSKKSVKKLESLVKKITDKSIDITKDSFKRMKTIELLLDIISNADRRAEQGQYDDAVLRLYRAMEIAGQIELANFNINDENVDLDNPVLTDEVKSKLREKLDAEGKIQLPLFAKYELLAHLGNPTGIKALEMQEDIRKVLYQRNYSFLAHNFQVLSEKHYRSFRDTLMKFLDPHTDKKLTTFPKMSV